MLNRIPAAKYAVSLYCCLLAITPAAYGQMIPAAKPAVIPASPAAAIPPVVSTKPAAATAVAPAAAPTAPPATVDTIPAPVSPIPAAPAPAIAESEPLIKLKATSKKGYPVSPFIDQTLFEVYHRLGSFSAAERADAISGRIKKIFEIRSYDPAKLKIEPEEQTIDIAYGETIIISVSEADAKTAGVEKTKLAEFYRTLINQAILDHKQATSWQTLGKEVGLTAIVVLSLILVIVYIAKSFKWVARKIESKENIWFKGVRIRSYELLNTKKQLNIVLSLNTVIKWLIILLAVYLALPIIFSIFPWTKPFADTLFGYVLIPLKRILLSLWNFLPNLFAIIVIGAVFRYVLKIVTYMKNEIESGTLTIPGFYPDWANPTYQIVRILIYAFALTVIFPYLPGSDSPVFQGISVFLGVLFTFGSSGSLSNIIAGLVLTYMRSFKIGDRVKIGDVTGDILGKSLLVTRVKTIKNEVVSIPNSSIMSSHTINYSAAVEETGLIVHSTVTIGYDIPWRQVHELLIQSASLTQLIEKKPPPFVLQTSLDDFYVSYQINAYTKEPNKQAIIYSDLHQHIQDAFNKAGVEILSPHYRGLRDGNMTTTPAEHLPKDYRAPTFIVSSPEKR